jgi:hypothetical protein
MDVKKNTFVAVIAAGGVALLFTGALLIGKPAEDPVKQAALQECVNELLVLSRVDPQAGQLAMALIPTRGTCEALNAAHEARQVGGADARRGAK